MPCAFINVARGWRWPARRKQAVQLHIAMDIARYQSDRKAMNQLIVG